MTTSDNKHPNARPCPGCGHDRGRSIGEKNSYEMLVCADCRTIYTETVPAYDPEEAYDDYYTEANLNVPDFIHARASEIIRGFAGYRSIGRMLDIGSGSGVLLDAARKQGWDAHGLEVSAPAVQHARAKGFDVFHGTLEEAEYPTGHFDLVTASEILEHLPDPEATLREVARILRRGGLLWATTPSSTGASFRLMGIGWSMIAPAEHSQLFSAPAVREMCRQAGFTGVSIKTHGIAPGEILHYYKQRRQADGAGAERHDRLECAYQLNEGLTRTPVRRFIKSTLNATLNAVRLGDSLKIFART